MLGNGAIWLNAFATEGAEGEQMANKRTHMYGKGFLGNMINDDLPVMCMGVWLNLRRGMNLACTE